MSSRGAIRMTVSCQADELDAAGPDVAVEGDRVRAQGQEHQPARDQGQQHGHHGAHDGLGHAPDAGDRPRPVAAGLHGRGLEGAGLRRRGLAAHAAADSEARPTISSPTRCSAPGPFWTMPVSRPRLSTAIRSQRATSSSRSVEISRCAHALAVRQLADAGAHGPGGEDVEPVGRLVVDHQARVVRELARQHDLLDVAARERPDARLRTGRPDVVLGDLPDRVALHLALADGAAPPERGLADALQDEVEADRERGDRPLTEAVVADVPQAHPLALPDREAGDGDAPEAHVPGRRRALPRDRLRQLTLAVPVDAGDAQDLAGAHLQRDVRAGPSRRRAPPRGGRPARAGARAGSSRAGRMRLDVAPAAPPARAPAPPARRTSCPRSRPAAGRGCGRASSSGARRPATRPCLSTVTRSPMPVASWSLWVMKTTARPWPFSRSSALASSVDPFRGEHRGGLVEDQHLGAPPERLDDLDLLLLPEAQRPGLGVRVDLDAEHGRHLGEARHAIRARRAGSLATRPSSGCRAR